VILGINSYDQWGVELGKELAVALQPVLEGKAGTEGKDGSTAALVAFLRPDFLFENIPRGVRGGVKPPAPTLSAAPPSR
jgi:hypothetical protein